MSAVVAWFQAFFKTITGYFINFLSSVVQFFVDVLVLVVNLCIDVLFWLLTLAGLIFPEVPELPFQASSGMTMLNVANYFFPVAEFFTGMAFIGMVYGLKGFVLLARFLRGGG